MKGLFYFILDDVNKNSSICSRRGKMSSKVDEPHDHRNSMDNINKIHS